MPTKELKNVGPFGLLERPVCNRTTEASRLFEARAVATLIARRRHAVELSNNGRHVAAAATKLNFETALRPLKPIPHVATVCAGEQRQIATQQYIRSFAD